MEYRVRRGNSIAQNNTMMDNNWHTLKKNTPQAMGRSNANNNRVVKEGTVLTNQPKSAFADALKSAEGQVSSKKLTNGAAKAQAGPTAANERTHTLKAGETVWGLATKIYHVNPDEILKLNNITNPRTLQIGQTLRIPEPRKQVGKEEVVASWYGQSHHGRTMANGEPFDMNAPTIAHKNIPFGTRVLLENPQTGQKVTATVTDRGPYIQGRDVDLSYKLAKSLSLDKQGVGNLTMQVL